MVHTTVHKTDTEEVDVATQQKKAATSTPPMGHLMRQSIQIVMGMLQRNKSKNRTSYNALNDSRGTHQPQYKGRVFTSPE